METFKEGRNYVPRYRLQNDICHLVLVFFTLL